MDYKFCVFHLRRRHDPVTAPYDHSDGFTGLHLLCCMTYLLVMIESSPYCYTSYMCEYVQDHVNCGYCIHTHTQKTRDKSPASSGWNSSSTHLQHWSNIFMSLLKYHRLNRACQLRIQSSDASWDTYQFGQSGECGQMCPRRHQNASWLRSHLTLVLSICDHICQNRC